jgi:hypothetical protein
MLEYPMRGTSLRIDASAVARMLIAYRCACDRFRSSATHVP